MVIGEPAGFSVQAGASFEIYVNLRATVTSVWEGSYSL